MTLSTEPPKDRPLDDATRVALVKAVEEAKARGWSQADLRRWFEGKSVTLADYLSAKSGGAVSDHVFGVLATISVVELPPRPYAPNTTDIRRHLEWLIAPARGAYDDAQFEIAWSHGDGGVNRAQLFGFDQIDEAIEFVVSLNVEGHNVYIGAGLRLPDAPRFKRSSAEDFYVATAVPIDIDTNYDAIRARMSGVCDDGLVVTTGLSPTRRSQHWTRLVEPCDDDITFGNAFAALVDHTGADAAVKDAARVMRLGGTVSYPNARKSALGYCTELTTVTINENARPSYLQGLIDLSPDAAVGERGDYSHRPAGTGIERGGILGTGKVVNGRELFFATKILPRSIRLFQSTHGIDPTADDLWQDAFARFCEEADNTDTRWTSPAGQKELKARVANTLRRLRLGRMARVGLYSIDTGVGEEEAKVAQAAFEAHRPQDEAAAEAEEEATAKEEAQAGLLNATPYRWIDPSKIPPRDLLYGKHFFRKFLSVTVSPGGLGKSSNAIVECLSMVTGRTLIGELPKGELRAWYWNGEDPEEELQRRIQAACIRFEITEADLGGRLFVDSGRDTEITIAREGTVGFQIAVPIVDALIATIKDRDIDVMVVDPFVASHAVSENDNTKIEAVVRQWMRVAELGGCSIELVHHVRKPSGGGSQETTVDDARGAGALLAKARSARVLNAMSTAEADEAGIDRKERWRFFRVENGKANLMPRGADAQWRQMVGVPLGNRIDAREDEVGVATEWIRPSVFVGMKEHHLPAIRSAVEAGDWRLDVQCSNWVGVAVAGALGVDSNDPREKARIKSMVATWIKNDVLRVVNMLDPNRKMKPFVIVGKDPE